MFFIKPGHTSVAAHFAGVSKGFSMVELMVALVIGAILVAFAAPQYSLAIQSQRSNTEITNLYNDLLYARSEALKEGQFVSLCASSSGTGCTSTTWDRGWIIYSDPTWTATTQTFAAATSTLLRVQPGFTTTDTISTSPSTAVFTYNRDGFGINLTSAGVLFTLHNSTGTASATRCIWLDITGHEYAQKSGAAAATSQQTATCT